MLAVALLYQHTIKRLICSNVLVRKVAIMVGHARLKDEHMRASAKSVEVALNHEHAILA